MIWFECVHHSHMNKIQKINTFLFPLFTFGNNCVDVVDLIHVEMMYTTESRKFCVCMFFLSVLFLFSFSQVHFFCCSLSLSHPACVKLSSPSRLLPKTVELFWRQLGIWTFSSTLLQPLNTNQSHYTKSRVLEELRLMGKEVECYCLATHYPYVTRPSERTVIGLIVFLWLQPNSHMSTAVDSKCGVCNEFSYCATPCYSPVTKDSCDQTGQTTAYSIVFNM